MKASDVLTLDPGPMYGADDDGPIPSAELQQVIVPGI